MKKLALVLTLALVLAFAAPVFANPFSDVPADHWAYEAINKLADDGVITGNPDGTYTGNKTMTRYELAVVVAKAMAAAEANSDKVSAEDKATIDKLAAEFGGELKALGVKVAALEKKVGNVKFTGDARLRYINDKDKDIANFANTSKYDTRVRLTATATVNDKVNVVARIRTNSDYNLSDPNAKGNSTADSNNNIMSDRFYAQYADKGVTVTAGRQDIFLGKGLIVDDAIKGIAVSAPVGKMTATLVNGRLDYDTVIGGLNPTAIKFDLTALQLDGLKLFNDKLVLGFDYAQIKATDNNGQVPFNNGDSNKLTYGAVSFDYAINPKLALYGEFTKSDYKDATNTQKSASIVGVKADVLPRTHLDVAVGQFGADSVYNSLTTYVDQLGYYNALGDADKTNLTKVTVNYDLLANTNFYVTYSTAEHKYTDIDKDKYERLETGLEFKF